MKSCTLQPKSDKEQFRKKGGGDDGREEGSKERKLGINLENLEVKLHSTR